MDTLGTRIRELRKSGDKISQEKLADIIGASRHSISDWEIGRSYPDPESLIRIANFFKVSIDYILGRTNWKYDFTVLIHTDEQKLIEDYIKFIKRSAK